MIPGEYGSFRHPLFILSPVFWISSLKSLWDFLTCTSISSYGSGTSSSGSTSGGCGLWCYNCLASTCCSCICDPMPTGLEPAYITTSRSSNRGSYGRGTSTSTSAGVMKQTLFTAKELAKIKEIPASAIDMLTEQFTSTSATNNKTTRGISSRSSTSKSSASTGGGNKNPQGKVQFQSISSNNGTSSSSAKDISEGKAK